MALAVSVRALHDRWPSHEPLVDAGAALPGVAEPKRAIGGIVPPGYLLSALGPRPLDARARDTWGDAALAIERYRDRWGVRDRREALGPANEMGGLGVAQLADRFRVAMLVDRRPLALGHERGAVLERSGRGAGSR